MIVIHNNVTKLRNDRGVTQEALAAAVGVSRQTIIALEKGNYTPSLSLAMCIGDYFKLPIEKIFTITKNN